MKTTKEELLKQIAEKDLIIDELVDSREMVIATFQRVLEPLGVDRIVGFGHKEAPFGFNEIFVAVGKLLACKTDSDVISKVETTSQALEDFSKELWDLKNGKDRGV